MAMTDVHSQLQQGMKGVEEACDGKNRIRDNSINNPLFSVHLPIVDSAASTLQQHHVSAACPKNSCQS